MDRLTFVQAAVRCLPRLSPSAFTVYCYMAFSADENTWALETSIDALADAIGITDKPLKSAIEILIALGALTRRKRFGRAAQYCLSRSFAENAIMTEINNTINNIESISINSIVYSRSIADNAILTETGESEQSVIGQSPKMDASARALAQFKAINEQVEKKQPDPQVLALSDAFTRIYQIGAYKLNDWNSALREMLAAGATIADLEAAKAWNDAEGHYPVTGPWSVLKPVAQEISKRKAPRAAQKSNQPGKAIGGKNGNSILRPGTSMPGAGRYNDADTDRLISMASEDTE